MERRTCAAGSRWQGRQRSAGGGGNDGDNEEGAGGGGSGGTVYLVAATLHIEGAITATGGFGGRDDFHYNGGANRECCNNGGPGSVGRIRLDYSADAILGGTITPPAGSRFAVITATQNAEGLPYGPGPIGTKPAYFCTDCMGGLSDSWTETVACDGSNVDMTIVYQFGSAMSVVDRMRQCSATGCNVGFTVYGPGITTTSFNSDWWFTKGATVLPSASGSRVSSDDGMWGGAPGEVNGDGQCYGIG